MQAGPSPTRGRKQEGGERGKLGPRDGIPYQTANSFQSLTKDFQRFWIVDICWEGRSQKSAPQKRHKAHLTSVPKKWGWDRRGNKACFTRVECARQAHGCLSCSVEEAQNAGSMESGSLWITQEPEPEWLRPGKCTQLRAHSLKNRLEPGQCRQGKHTCCEQGQTQCGWNTVSTPHTPQWYLSAVLLPPHSTTELANLNKRPPLPTCVRVEIRHWRDLQTEAKWTNGTTSQVTGAMD